MKSIKELLLYIDRTNKKYLGINLEVSFEESLNNVTSIVTIKNKDIKVYFNISDFLNHRKSYLRDTLYYIKSAKDKYRKATKTVVIGGHYTLKHGLVFCKPNQINLIAESRTKNYYKTPISKDRHVGIELEFNANVNCSVLFDELGDNGLYKYICVDTEHAGQLELKILAKETEYKDVLFSCLEVLKQYDTHTTHNAGLHVHLDMRSRDHKKCYNNLYMFQNSLTKLFDVNRIFQNTYTRYNTKSTFDETVSMGIRSSINAMSYKKHKTLEIRMSNGSIDYHKITKWIDLLIKIANYEEKIDNPIISLTQAKNVLKLNNDYVNYFLKNYNNHSSLKYGVFKYV